jgi:hypothetical protein
MKNTQTEIEQARAAWLAEHPFKPGMSPDEALRLNEEFITLFPMTPEECNQRAKEMVGEEFVL